MSKPLLFFLFLSGFISTTNAQLKVIKCKWETNTKMWTIPDSLKKEDAVMLWYRHRISNVMIDQYRFIAQSTETIYKRIKFQTKAGIDNYSKFFLSKGKSDSFEILDARTIKPGNKVVELSDDDLKKLDFSYTTTGTARVIEQVRFSIPGIEVGDEVEVCYKIISRGLNSGEDVFMFSYLPCLRSTFTYEADKNVWTDVNDVSTMPLPFVLQTDTSKIYTWEMTGLPAFGKEENSIPALPAMATYRFKCK